MAPDTLERPSLGLMDTSLLRQQCYVDGEWIGADDGASMPVVDPATGGSTDCICYSVLPVLCSGKQQEAARRCIVAKMLSYFFRVAAMQYRLRVRRYSGFGHRRVWIFLVFFARLGIVRQLVDEIGCVLV